MDALRRLDQALVPGGKLVDTQPLSPRPSVFAAGERLGSLDMREWARTIAAVDEQVERVLDEGLFELAHEQRFLVDDTFADGPECLQIVGEWAGTGVSRNLAARLRRVAAPIRVEQDVRLRLLARPERR